MQSIDLIEKVATFAIVLTNNFVEMPPALSVNAHYFTQLTHKLLKFTQKYTQAFGNRFVNEYFLILTFSWKTKELYDFNLKILFILFMEACK